MGWAGWRTHLDWKKLNEPDSKIYLRDFGKRYYWNNHGILKVYAINVSTLILVFVLITLLVGNTLVFERDISYTKFLTWFWLYFKFLICKCMYAIWVQMFVMKMSDSMELSYETQNLGARALLRLS